VPDPADARKQAVARPRWRRRAAGALRDDGLQWRCAVEDGGGGREIFLFLVAQLRSVGQWGKPA
jgi:hypothetical protein